MRVKIHFSFRGFFLLCAFLYFTVLGSTGWLERKNLEARLKTLKDEVERLEIEYNHLKNRHAQGEHFYGADYQFIPENAYIIKFKEFVEVEGENEILTSKVPLFILRNKQIRNQTSNLQFLKFLYMTVAFTVGIIAYLKYKRK
ncbi:MAG: hypothetical protein N3A69_11200 [Leptospiraceae bacterium]|nr:hypothetical protein [Leptospiraceae bacterium]